MAMLSPVPYSNDPMREDQKTPAPLKFAHVLSFMLVRSETLNHRRHMLCALLLTH